MRVRMLLGWVALALVCGAGCETTRTQIKPPIPADEVRDPPENDARYSNAPRYPKGTLNQAGPRREVTEAGGPTGPNANMSPSGSLGSIPGH